MPIDFFDGSYRFLSNYYISPFVLHSIEYQSVEHFFQATKAQFVYERDRIIAAPTPGKAKRLGKGVALRPDWEEIKEDVMMQGLREKFNIPELREKLLATGDQELIEGNIWHDNIWGDCRCSKCYSTKGQNKLGKLLMQLRQEIRESL